ncbi:hypothetical protein ACFX13_000305 [Malus domestica]
MAVWDFRTLETSISPFWPSSAGGLSRSLSPYRFGSSRTDTFPTPRSSRRSAEVLDGRMICLWRDVWVPNLLASNPIPIGKGSVDSIINRDVFGVNRDSISTFVEWICRIGSADFRSKQERSRAFSLVALSCWHIWKSRWKVVFDHCLLSPTITIVVIKNEFDCFSVVTNCTFLPPPPRAPMLNRCPPWSPPLSGVVKVNVDASWMMDEDRGFVGVVIPDAQVRCVERNFNRIIMESNSKLVISSLVVGLECTPWEVLLILSRVLESRSSFRVCTWSWVPRSANAATDFVATHLVARMCNSLWVAKPSSSLVRILNKDGLPCPL